MQVYGCNHLGIEVDDVEKAVVFYQDVFNLEKLDEGESDAFLKLGAHQFLAIFKVDQVEQDHGRHFGIIVRDKLTRKYGLKLRPVFRCEFHDPFGNRIQVVDLHDESLVWLVAVSGGAESWHHFQTRRRIARSWRRRVWSEIV